MSNFTQRLIGQKIDEALHVCLTKSITIYFTQVYFIAVLLRPHLQDDVLN